MRAASHAVRAEAVRTTTKMKVPLFCSKRKRKRERRTIGAARRREVCSVYTCYAMPSSLRYSRATSDSLERGRELREPEALELPRAVCGGARGRRASGARQRSDAEREVCSQRSARGGRRQRDGPGATEEDGRRGDAPVYADPSAAPAPKARLDARAPPPPDGRTEWVGGGGGVGIRAIVRVELKGVRWS